MQLICQHLDLIDDQNFINKWMNYHYITGHVYTRDEHQIRAKIYPDRSKILELFLGNPYYKIIIDQLGYDYSPSQSPVTE